jgi:hypothetical protein
MMYGALTRSKLDYFVLDEPSHALTAMSLTIIG